MKLRLPIWLALFVLGLALAPLGVSGDVFMGIIVMCFLIIIVTNLRAAWRQGHSGSVILPFKRGPFGYDGLKLKASPVESSIIIGSALVIAGMFAGLVIAIGLE